MPSTTPGPLRIRPLTFDDAPLVDQLLRAAAEYTQRVRGRTPLPGDGAEILTERPPGLERSAKHIIGAFRDSDLLGLCDVLQGWPDETTAHIGLLVVDPAARGHGVGSALDDHAEDLARSWPAVRRMRLGIVSTNQEAGGFWRARGYSPTGEKVPYASGSIAATTVIWGQDVMPAEGRDTSAGPEGATLERTGLTLRTGLHHLELWTHDLAGTEPSFAWLLERLGWTPERVEGWELGRIWRWAGGPYIVLEQSDAVQGTRHERTAPGMNHLALTCPDRATLDQLRADAAQHGWHEMFAEQYPHAGGEDHTAWYAENREGFEVEVVVSRP